ncbi:hypothetical protein MNBD_GAMMA23-1368 [hydrothermal vent metagenome]|uniref:YhdP central domain-containing protein n=1 Tax=hydrothermal vent metagenome TaxID=652676 RepID=A0A3B1ASH5_9ZZZZ
MLNRIRNFILYIIIATIILLAIGLSAARIFLPDVQSYRSYVEQQLGKVIEHPVKIGDLDAFMSGVTPVIVFHDVKLMSRKNKRVILEIAKIRIGFSLLHSIKEAKIVPNIYTIDGVELAIIRKKDGKILVQDVDVADIGGAFSEQDLSNSNELSDWLFNRSSLVIQNSSIIWHDKKSLTEPTHFKNVTLKLKNNRNRHQFNGEFILSPQDKAKPKKLELALDVYGDMLDPIKWVGKFYANGQNINANEWGFKPVIMDVMVEQGQLDFELWGDWVAGELNQISADVTAHDVVLKRLKTNASANVKLLGGLIKWNKDANDWDLSIEKLKFISDKSAWPETEVKIARQYVTETKTETIETNIEYCRVEDIRDLLLKSGYIDDVVFKYLHNASPAGEFRNINYRLVTQESKIKEYSVSAKVDNFSLNSSENIPGLRGVSGEFFTNKKSGLLKIKTKNAELSYADILLKPISIDSLIGNIEWIKNKTGWIFSSDKLKASNADVTGEISFNLNISDHGASPYMELQSKIEQANANAVFKYLPAAVMTGDFKAWMESAFITGEIENGEIILHGRLDEFPYNEHQGVFKGYFTAKNLEIDYKSGWPHLRQGETDVAFTGRGIELDVKHVELLNSYADNFKVGVDDYLQPLLKTTVQIKSNLDDVAQYSSTTFLKEARDFVEGFKFSGTTNIDVVMGLPLSDEVEKLSPLNLKAKAFLLGVDVVQSNNKLYAKNIIGEVDLTQDSVTASGIKANIMGGKSIVDIFTRHEFGSTPIRLVMQGNIDVGKTMQRFGIPGYDRVAGRTDWQGVFTLKHEQDGVVKNPLLQVTTNMENISINLPTPMNKLAKESVPAYMTIENVSTDTMLLHLVYDEAMSYAMDIDLSDSSARLRRGEFRFKTKNASIPDEKILLLTGSLWDFSLGDWLDALDSTSNKGKKSFLGIPVKVDMDVVHLVKAKNQQPRKPSDPRKLPTFEGEIGQLEYDTFQYGKAYFKTSRKKDGLSLDKFTITSPHVDVEGKAYWNYRPRKQSTEVTMMLRSENYGELLTSLGFNSLIENGTADFSGDFNWNGGFGDFYWGTLNGVITMDIKNGVFTKIDPGAGRMLGLLSIESLPGMIFSGDAFKSGFNFDRIVGNYNISDGNAFSDDVSITGPAAYVLVTGRTGIVARDFDHYVTVVPNVSSTLPLTSGAIFGPQVGAIVYFFKKLFGAGIDESSKRIYHLTGTWKSPIIKRIDKNEDKPDKNNVVADESDEDF